MASGRSNSDECRITKFPNLHDIANPSAEFSSEKLSHEFKLPECIQRNAVIISWALLLRGYTGLSRTAFMVDKKAMSVDFEGNTIDDVVVAQSPRGASRETGIFFSELQKNDVVPELYLRVDLDDLTASFVASVSALPGMHVPGLISQLQHILSYNPTSPRSVVPQYPVVTENSANVSEISVLNPSPVQISGPRLLHELVGICSDHSNTADRINAIEFLAADGNRTVISYERLHSLSNHLARDIDAVIDKSTGRKSIPVLLPQSPLLYVALLAVLKAGAAFVPLDLDAPKERIRFVVADVGASVVITNAHFSSSFGWEDNPKLIQLDDDNIEDRKRWPYLSEKLSKCIAHTDPAYVMYTSGSTGIPKGVIISHSAAVQSILAHNKHIPKFQRFLQFAAPTFDVSVFEIFFPWFRGCTLVGCDRGRMLSDLPKVINIMNIDAAELTPTIAGEILGKRESVPGLNILLTIGEMLTRRVIDEFGDGVLQGMYGPTEAAIHCTISTNFRRDAKVGDIGVPLDTVSVFIVGPPGDGKPDVEILPVGWVGELAVGGYQLADGYLKRPDITNDVFIESARWGLLYRTGDRARILPSGRIECLGRVSSGQVKLRGQRIELGEIEEVVLKIPGVKMAVASVVNGTLVTYFSSPEPVETEAVKTFCSSWLPSFMVPSASIWFEDLPRLPSGKADRKLLDKEFSKILRELNVDRDEELSDIEKTIVDAVESTIRHRPGKTQSLSSIGLDSISAIRLVSTLRSCKIMVEVLDLVKADTVTGISIAINSHANSAIHPSENPIVKERFKEIFESGKSKLSQFIAEIDDIIPCTSLQEAMLAETARDGNSYCNSILLNLPADVNFESAKSAFFGVVQRNEILRTGFLPLDNNFAQVIWKRPRNSQFTVCKDIEYEWSTSLDDLLEPPFSARFVHQENDDKVLSIRIHHAVYDGWSWENILSQFQILLSGSEILSTDQPQFREVVEWELARPLAKMEAAREFWTSRLSGVGETRLPNFNGSEVQPAVSVAVLSLSSSRSDYESVARGVGVSPQVLIQTAWCFLLSLYVGKDDLAFGIVVSGRTTALEGIQEIIGPTILTLPIRAQMQLDRNLRDVMRDINSFNRELLQYTELGLREVRKYCGEDASFDSLLVWQQTANDSIAGTVEVISSRDKLEFSILIEAEPTANEIQLKATFKNEIIPRSQVLILLQQLDRLIDSILRDPNQILREMFYNLDESLLSIENPQPKLTDPFSTRTLATCFEEAASKYPDIVALEFANNIQDGLAKINAITFSELNKAANQLAVELIDRGTVRDELVAVCMEKSVKCYIAILAIVKAGAGYLPLTAETPDERLKQILHNAEVKILLTTRDISKRVGSLDRIQTINVEEIDVSRHRDENPDLSTPSRSLGYAVFTSGSTGVPKGVLVEHEQAVGMLGVLADIYPTKPGKRLLQFCSIAFDVSVFEIFFTWTQGMTLCVGTKDVLLRDLEGAINALKVTHLSMTPTVAALVNPTKVPDVEFLVTAGEAVTKKVFNEWADRGLYQGYGPSETTNICSVNPRVKTSDNISNIGMPLVNTSAFVVDASDTSLLTLLPRGAVGELCFGGVQVCRGYLRMPELTDAKFITHSKFGRLYRSGDIGRILPSGEMIIQGRQDDQVKIRGNRIELGEITSVLLRQFGVSDATALVMTHKEAGAQLVAFAALKEHQTQSFCVVSRSHSVQNKIASLFNSLNQYLPAYMVPHAVLPLSLIPMTAQGKTDKQLLRKAFSELESEDLECFSGGLAFGDEESKEWDEIEKKVANVLATIAHAKFQDITRKTSIYTLGLDSISAIHLSTKLSKSGFLRLDVSQIMRNPTVPAMARILKKENSEKRQSSSLDGALAVEKFASNVREFVLKQIKYSKDEVVKVLPCTPLQEAMLSMKNSAEPKNFYNHTVFNLKADSCRLHNAWKTVAETHDIMRTCFAVTSCPQHPFAQVVLKSHKISWKKFEVSEVTSDAIEDHINKTSQAMDMSYPPYGFAHFKSSNQSVLVMSFHHSLYDGFAMDLLLSAVKTAYDGLEIAQETPFLRFLEFAEGLDLEEAGKFWKNMLTGLESSSFPDLTGKSKNIFRKKTISMTSERISCSMPLSAINRGCRKLSISLQALGQSSWARLLAVYTGEADVCFGNVVSGRTVPVDGVERIVAPCFNTVPLRVQVLKNKTNISLVEDLQKINSDIIPYQLTPLRKIMVELKTNGESLFDTLFILQSSSEENFEDMWEVMEDRGVMDFSVVVELVPRPVTDRLDIAIHFREDIVLDEDTIVLLQQFDEAMVTVLKQPQFRALDFSGFTDSLLSGANPVPFFHKPRCPGLLHKDFERLAEESCNKKALEWLNNENEISSWTFAEMNDAANQIAHYLLKLDLKRDEAVPLCIEKSPLYYMCVLAVLKAGCAFTPIDPSLPEQRKIFMIKELGARITLAGLSGKGLTIPGVRVIDIEGRAAIASVSGQRRSNPNVSDLTDRCLAYRLYTSGSTGQPKAVSMEHRSAMQTIQESKSIIRWKHSSRILQFAAITFDMCYYDIFMAWSYGFTLCTASAVHLLGNLQETITRMKITILDLTPTVASVLDAKALKKVELLYCIGEVMPSKVAKNWEGRCVNSYGPTEAAMCCTITDVKRDIKAANIGKPFKTTKFAVLSTSHPALLPRFAAGELCIGGHQLAREYHNNPELTASRFIRYNKEILYRTGDIVRQLGDGTFEFIGRADDQVKIRGLRVELDEINNILRESSDDIRDIATVVLKHSAETKDQLVSFLALEHRKQHGAPPIICADNQMIVKSARFNAQRKLPRYMVPGIMLVIDHVPLSAAGKVDKKALGSLFRSQDLNSDNSADSEVFSVTEHTIRRVLSELSQVPVEEIRRSTTIYELGLDSISASQIARKLEEACLKISVLHILECPSIELLSARLNTSYDGPALKTTNFYVEKFNERYLPKLAKELQLKPTKVYPCTATQEGIISQFLRSSGKLYFNHILFDLWPGLDLSCLQKSWRDIHRFMDIFRTGFVELGDDNDHSFAMILHGADSQITFPWVSVKCSPDEIECVIAEQKQIAIEKAFENLNRPPWQATLIQTDEQHWFIFSGLHAIYDATTLRLLFQELSELYARNAHCSFPPNDNTIEKIITHKVDPVVIADDKEFWIKHLEGSSVCRMPNLCPVRVSSKRYHVVKSESTWELSKIETTCKKLGISVQSAGQAAWSRVLSAYTGETVLTIGTVFSGRTGLPDAKAFPCVVTLPSVVALVGSNLQLALKIQSNNSAVLKHQHTPLRYIQRWLGHAEESFFDSIFLYQKTDVGSHENHFIPWALEKEDASADYAFSLELEPAKDDKLLITATAADNLVPSNQTNLVVSQFKAVFLDILQNPDGSCTDFSNIPQELLSVTPADIDEIPCETKLLHKFVERSRELSPNKIAFEFVTAIDEENNITKQTWTYAQLDEEGNKVANFLLSSGVKTGNIVGISFEKCPEASFAILGILKAGCAYVAIDYSAPIDRKAFVVRDSKAVAVLTQDKYVDQLQAAVKVRVVSAESEPEIFTASVESPFISDLTPDNLSYCLYTSGTTGTPKGCELTHENAVQAMLAFQRLFTPHWDSNSKWLQFASFHFDVSVLEQYWPWSVGICVTSAPRDLIFQDLAGTINTLKITHLDLTPSLAAFLTPQDVPSLCRGVFITGGEALKQEILDTWGETGVIYNGYGPTEVTIGCTMYPRVPANGKPSNIGPQFDNIGSYVFAPGTENPVLRGAIGELCVSGKLVGRGYLNRLDLTKKKFPYLEQYEERVYRTGDLVRILYDGTFDFAGRADDQVKLRGQRLEIGEINDIVKKAPGTDVKEVATLVLRHPKQQKDQLVSFVILGSVQDSPMERGAPPVVCTVNKCAKVILKLVSACKSKLPTYMVPTHFLPLSHMPLSINNKVDNKSLKALYEDTTIDILQSLSRIKEDKESDWTEAERKLRDVLVEMSDLNENVIRRSSTIFELGLDSIAVVGLARRLKKNGFGGASASTVLQNPVISEMARVLSSESIGVGAHDSNFELTLREMEKFADGNKDSIVKTLGVRSDSIASIMPCTSLQEGMIARFLDSDKPLYFNCFPMELKPSTDLERLKKSWQNVISSNDILRTCFCETEDGYAQVVLRVSNMRWEEIELSGNTESIEQVIARSFERSINGNQKLHLPPVSISVVHSQSRVMLSLNIFHAVYDGTSLPVILDEVCKAYGGASVERTVQFGDVMPHLLASHEGAQEFWQQNINPGNSLPLDQLEGTPGSRDYSIEAILSDSDIPLEKLCRKLQCTAQAIFQAAWASTLAKYVGPQVTMGVVVSGRSLPIEDVETVIGPTFNTVPCSVKVDASSWEKLVQEIQRFNSASIPFHNTPLRKIQKFLKRTSDQPLFETLFVYQKDSKIKDGNKQLWNLCDGSVAADYPMSLEVLQTSSGDIHLTIVAEAGLARDKVSSILHDFQVQLGSLFSNPQETPFLKPESPSEEDHSISEDNKSGSEFIWDENARILRKTISKLADVSEDEITADSTILELGLDSIEAIKLSSRLKRHNIEISVSTIMRNTSIRKMKNVFQTEISETTKSSQMSSSQKMTAFETAARRQFGERPDVVVVYPTTPLQEAMIAETLASDYNLYFNHDVLKIDPLVDLQRLQEAWSAVVKENDILRTSFFLIQGEKNCGTYGQIVHKTANSDLHEFSVPEEVMVNGAIEDVMQKIKKNADLLREPPVYLSLIKGPRSSYIILSISHALYDGWSIGLLHQDLRKAYLGELKKRPSPRLLIENAMSTGIDGSRDFWSETLSGAVSSQLPTSTVESDSSLQNHRFERESSVSFSEVQDFCKINETTVQTLGKACWGLLLAQLLGESDVLFGTVLSGRDFESAEDIMFPAINTVPVRVLLEGSFKQILQKLQDQGSMTLKYQYTPLREIQKISGNAGNRLFDTLFLYQPGQVVSNDEKPLYESVGGSSDVEYNIAVEMERSNDKLMWRNACKSNALDAHAAERLLKTIDSLLVHILRNPDSMAMELEGNQMTIGNLSPVERREGESLNGMRVSLEHVARVIETGHPSIKNCAAIITNEKNEEIVVAFIETSEPESAIPESMNSAKTKLPHWSIPKYILDVENVNSRNLREKFSTISKSGKLRSCSTDASWSPLEDGIRRVLSNVSGIPEQEIQRTQTIFHVGLDSISAIKLSSDLRKAGYLLSVADILREATIERMATFATKKCKSKNCSPVSFDTDAILKKSLDGLNVSSSYFGLSESQVEAILPTTPGQLYMLSAWRNSGYTLFMPTFGFATSAPVEINKVQTAWESLVRQQPILRTSFRLTGSERSPFVQVVLSKSPLQFISYGSLESVDSELLESIKKREQKRDVDMSIPPVRLCAIQTPTKTYLFLTIHHALYDGVSLELILSKLLHLIEYQPSRLSTPDPEGSTFPNFVALIQAQNTRKQRDFWKSYLQGAQISVLSWRRFRNLPDSRSYCYRPQAYHDAKTLEASCKRAGLSVQSVFLAAFAKVYLDQLSYPKDELVIGLFLSNRHFMIPDLVSMTAPTLNLVPVRIREIRKTKLSDLARVVQNDLIAIGSTENSVVDLQSIEQWTGITVDCFFNFLKMPSAESKSPLVPGKKKLSFKEMELGATGPQMLAPSNVSTFIDDKSRELDNIRASSPQSLGQYFIEGKTLISFPNLQTHMDIEVSVRGSSVDVGVFASAAFFSDGDLREIVSEICEVVDGF